MALEKEIERFDQKQAELSGEHAGQFVLIHGTDDFEFFTSYDDAIKAGYQKYGLAPFLVKQIQAVEQVHFIYRSPISIA